MEAIHLIDDKILYENFLAGDIQAFETLVLQYKDNLIYFISRYTGGDIFLSEDIAQDVFAYIYAYKEKYDLKYSFKTFIFTLGKNKAIDYGRKRSKERLTAFEKDYEVMSEEESLEDKIIRDEEKKMLFENLKKLKPDYERAIYLADFEELAYSEIGKIMGKTLGQTKILIYRARQALKKEMEGVRRDEKR